MFSRSGIAAEDLMNNGLLVGGVTDAQEAIENIKRRYEEKKKKLEEKRKIKTSSYKKITKLERVDVYTSTLLLVLLLNMTKYLLKLSKIEKYFI